MEDVYKMLFSVCIPWKCEYKHGRKNFCHRDCAEGCVPSKETMLNCSIKYNLEKADEYNRLLLWKMRQGK